MAVAAPVLSDLFAAALRKMPEEELVLLQRAATVQHFDAALYAQVLTRELEAPDSFQEISSHPTVQQVPGAPGQFQVSHAFREQLFNSWWPVFSAPGSGTARQIPEPLQRFSGWLADYYADDPLEQLYHLVAADRKEAAERFRTLFDKAEEAFDLARCHALIRVLEQRNPILGPKLARLVREKRLRLESRSLWAKEYYETIVYLEREQTRDLIEELIRGETREGKAHWILHIFARGGMGKSMLIRDAIARKCVEAGVPVARIDFDFVPDLASAVRQPWQLLLKIAEQLNPQMHERPFEELLRDFARYIPQTTDQRDADRRKQPPLRAEEQERVAHEVPLRFGDAVEDVWGDHPFVVIFDTLENLRQQQVEMDRAFRLLNEIHLRCPGLRLLLSGRFNLAEAMAVAPGQSVSAEARVPGFVEMFGDNERTVELKGFSDEEARDYLEKKRGLAGDDRVGAIIEKAQGNPFKLAILADVATREQISAEEIAAYPDADYVYLIRRIINRIEEKDVRWLLRYGVVPQRLTLSFVREVMAPYLLEAMAGHSPYDDPASDNLPESVKAAKPFRVSGEAASELDLDEVWQRLYRYASGYSWVSVASDVPDAVVFHPDVASPMRRLLRDHPIYLVLHRAAFAHYQGAVEAGETHTYRKLREAVYHRYHMGEEGADAYWLAQLERFEKVPEAVAALAEQVVALAEPQLSRYWTTAAGTVQPAQENGIDEIEVANTVLAQAHFQLARLQLERSEQPGNDDLFRAQQLLRVAERLGAKQTVPAAELRYRWAQVWFGQGETQKAIKACAQALAAKPDPVTAVGLRMLAVEAYRADPGSDSQAARAAIDEAQETVRAASLAQAMPAAQIIDVQRRLDGIDAAQAEDDEDLVRAAAAYGRLLERSVEPPDVLLQTLNLMRVLAAMGREQAAQETGMQGEKQLEGARAATGLLRAQVALLAARPTPVLKELQQLQSASSAEWEETGLDFGAVLLALRAEVARAVMDLSLASSLLQSLIFSYSDPESAAGFDWCIEAARLFLEETDDMNQVSYYLDLARDRAGSNEQKWRVELLLARFLRRAGRTGEADNLIADLLVRPAPPLPSLRLQRELLHLAERGAGGAAGDTFVEAVAQIEPPSRRLLLLEALRSLPTPTDEAPQMAQRLAALIPDVAPGEEPARRALRQAEVARFSGDIEHARGLLGGLLERLEPGEVPLLLETLRALDRTGGQDPRLLERGTQLVEQASQSVSGDDPGVAAGRELRFLYGALLLEHAMRLFRSGEDAAGAQHMLDRAAALLEGGTLWQGRMLVLRGDLAAARGEAAAAIDAYGQAIAQAESSGDRSRAEQYRARQGALQAQAEQPATPAVDEQTAVQQLAIRLQWDRPQQWHIYFERVTGPNVRAQAGDARTAKLTPEMATYFSLEHDEVFSYRLARAFSQQWEKMGLWLGELLFDATTRLMLRDQIQHDIGLSVAARELSWLPWEFWRLPDEELPHTLGDECRNFYRSIPRPTVPARLEAGPASALIVRAGQIVETKMMRGYTQHGVSLLKQYYGAGIDGQEASILDKPMLFDAVSRLQPFVLHIVAGIREQRGHVFLDFAGGYPSAESQVTAKDLAVTLSRTGRATLVILDVPAPPSETERVRQLCLRNAFASELAQAAPVLGVVGTGLGDPGEQLDVTERLVDGLAGGVPLGEVVRGIRQQARDRWEAADPYLFLRLLPFVGTALFIADPQQSISLRR